MARKSHKGSTCLLSASLLKREIKKVFVRGESKREREVLEVGKLRCVQRRHRASVATKGWTVNFQMTQNNEVWVGSPGFNTSVVVPFPAETVNGRPKRFSVVFVPNQFTSKPPPKLLLTPELRKSTCLLHHRLFLSLENNVEYGGLRCQVYHCCGRGMKSFRL